FQSLNVYDEVTVSMAGTLEIEPLGEWATIIPTDNTNLAWKAAELVAAAYGVEPNFHISINKRIPVAAGLAGGSADGAAALVACDAVLGSALSRVQLDEMASQLGSDVPFMLRGGCALGQGRGHLLSPVMTRGSFHWVLATFREGLSTAAMYAKLDDQRRTKDGIDLTPDPQVPEAVLHALARGDAQLLGAALFNDLQGPAIATRPALKSALDFGMDYGALGCVVSGSGPTCAFLVADESKAIDLVIALMGSGLVDHALHAHGPVHGARVIPR
ncbi:MAG: 4-(cytidine 5'-diphospho)-2-C-methyl-D-erythritol kinase, partial [Actinobacteria bacterium]|nr:4-(cytidine 5'-diphospho)-2-C-methyl-D-erythritol kinase [Actinomycetota bacterium]